MTAAFAVALVIALIIGILIGAFGTLLWATRHVRGRDRIG